MKPNNKIILDTLKFTKQKIFLKKYHCLRTFEAVYLLYQQIKLEDVKQAYEKIEALYAKKIQDDQILRILFKYEYSLTFEAEIIQRINLAQAISLQLLLEPKQLSGLGIQNYKWSEREFWTAALTAKDPKADDVICLNENLNITETSRCNLFFYDQQKQIVYTPTLQTGCINGVYRRYVLENKSIMLPELREIPVLEFDIDYKKLATYDIYVANSVREVLKAKLFL